MAAYLVANIEVTDPEGYREYARQAGPTVAKYGGRYLVRGGPAQLKEGEWQIHRLVVVEFPSMERALAWYDSPEYAPVKPLRQRYARSRMAFVEGYTPPA